MGRSVSLSPSDLVSKRKERRAFEGYALVAILRNYARVTHQRSIQTPVPRPPVNAEYLLYLILPKADQDCEIGDLVERYGRLAQRFNKRRADFWYYKQVAGLGFSTLRRIAFKIGGLIWLGRILRRLIS